MTVQEFTDAWFRANEKHEYRQIKDGPRKEFAGRDLLGIRDDGENDWRVVFWFDN
jgi:hypothetical protein